MNYSNLPWNFEAFRKFITFQAVQNAASVVVVFDKKDVIYNSKLLNEFQSLLSLRSGMVWEPVRKNSDAVMFNNEGNVFRNKARVLSSLYLINPFSLRDEGILEATSFSRILASGKMSEQAFYDYIITSYEYPHPAYDENWELWNDAGIRLKPFIFMLQILSKLFSTHKDNAYLTVDEFARFAHSNPFQDHIQEIVDQILASREAPSKLGHRERSDKIDRKIGDLFGFLCMSGYTYYDGSKIFLNLISRHPEEGTLYYHSRNGSNVLDRLNILIEGSLAYDK